MDKRTISFSPPDITELEIIGVGDALRSGWITTGPRTKLLEHRLSSYLETGKVDIDCSHSVSSEKYSNKVVCVNSATAAEELNLRILGVGEGDEVLVPAYTYSATASAAIHCGATVKFIDIQKDGNDSTHSPEMNYDVLADAIGPKTKAIIAVDFGGIVCDYNRLFSIAEKTRDIFNPVKSDGSYLSEINSKIQKGLGRVAIISDCAHSLGASRTVKVTGQGEMASAKKINCGRIADFSSFSFHAVKNFTTAEGGAATWCLPGSVYDEGIDDSDIYKCYQLLSLHGQNKDALAKNKAGSWEYDIIGPWYKCNMTDVVAAIGLAQLDRYPSLLLRREQIISQYNSVCDELGIYHLVHHTNEVDSSKHLYCIRIPDASEIVRNQLITLMSEDGIATNVHYKPLPMMTAYKGMSGGIDLYPNSYDYYHNLLTLPLHTLMSDDDVCYVCESLKKHVQEFRKNGYIPC